MSLRAQAQLVAVVVVLATACSDVHTRRQVLVAEVTRLDDGTHLVVEEVITTRTQGEFDPTESRELRVRRVDPATGRELARASVLHRDWPDERRLRCAAAGGARAWCRLAPLGVLGLDGDLGRTVDVDGLPARGLTPLGEPFGPPLVDRAGRVLARASDGATVALDGATLAITPSDGVADRSRIAAPPALAATVDGHAVGLVGRPGRPGLALEVDGRAGPVEAEAGRAAEVVFAEVDGLVIDGAGRALAPPGAVLVVERRGDARRLTRVDLPSTRRWSVPLDGPVRGAALDDAGAVVVIGEHGAAAVRLDDGARVWTRRHAGRP